MDGERKSMCACVCVCVAGVFEPACVPEKKSRERREWVGGYPQSRSRPSIEPRNRMEWLATELQGRTAFRNVSYVDTHQPEKGKEEVKCNLCRTRWMDPHQRHEHFHGDAHARKYAGLERALHELQQHRADSEELQRIQGRQQTCEDVLRALHAASFPWPSAHQGAGLLELKGHLYDYCRTGQHGHLLAAQTLLARFQKRHRVGKLGLLRVAIQLSFPGSADPVAELRLQGALHAGQEALPKEYMHRLRHGDVHRVLVCVLPFVA